MNFLKRLTHLDLNNMGEIYLGTYPTKNIFFDLDGTLIKTVSGKEFPEDATDFRIRKDVLDTILKFKGLDYIFIVSNQGGIPRYVIEQQFLAKLQAIRQFIELYTGICTRYVYATSRQPDKLKPNVDMFEEIKNTYGISASVSIMVGDASGKEGDFSDSDLQFAENCGMAYFDVEEFINSL